MAKRANNFSSDEVKERLEVIHRHKYVVENKKTDRVTVEDKNKAWKLIENEFNALFPEIFRSEKVLRTKYGNLKRNAKKNYASSRREHYKTGGGACNISTTAEDELVMNICQSPQILGDIAVYDDDVIDEVVTEDLIEEVSASPSSNASVKPVEAQSQVTAKTPQTNSWAKLLKKPKNKNLRVESLDGWATVAQCKISLLKAKESQQAEEHALQMDALRAQIQQTKEEHMLRISLLKLQLEEQTIKLENLRI